MKSFTYHFTGFLFFCLATFHANAYDKVVAKDGSGDFTTVQAAINAVPTNLTSAYTIFIKNGRYAEKVTIPSNKPFIQLIGESVANTTITWDDYGGIMTSCSGILGTSSTATVTVNANDFSAYNITFDNPHVFGVPDNNNQQAVAVMVNADRSVFKNCRFLGFQDTLYLKGGSPGKAYFNNCYIDGITDFIFGSSIAVFDSCVIYAKTRTGTAASYITAPNTPLGQSYGFVFRDARLPNNLGTTVYYLSRPWPSPDVASTRQKAVFLSARMGSNIQPAGWSTWDANTVTANTYYGEYNSRFFNGNATDVSNRAAWSYQLNQADSATYTLSNMFGSWDPCAALSGACSSTATPIAVSNFKGVKGGSSSQFNWNISWPMAGIQYDLMRSTDGTNYATIYTTVATTDTAINFQYTDNSIPASGSKYYYYLAASKAGYATHITDTIQISNAAALTVTASLALVYCGFSQAVGTPSGSQSFTVSGSNLTGNIIITPPANYEASLNNTNFFTSASPVTITPASGTVATTTVYLRLNAASAGNYSGNVTVATPGVTSTTVAVSGSAFAPPTSSLLERWPLTANTNDSAAVRANGITATVPTFHNLFASDNTTPVGNTIPPYSGKYGQAFGANVNGNGWSAVGGTLKRDYYQEFKVTAASGYNVRVDSITLYAAFYLTTSSTKMGIVYSKNGFNSPADSTEITGGLNSSNTSLTTTASGNFAKSFVIGRNDAGPGAADYYALSLNNTGVTITSGQTLTIRIYLACSSSTPPRFAFLKNVSIMGVATSTAPTLIATPTTLSFANTIASSNSASQSFTLSGTNLTGGPGNITVTAPNTDFQVSSDDVIYGSSTTVPYASATMSATTVYIRFTPQSTGAKSGNITLSGGGAATPPTVALSGTGIPCTLTSGFSYATPYCNLGTATVTLSGGATAGTFSSTAGLSINASTGAVNLALSTPGTYTVTNSATSGPCTSSSTNTITINRASTAPTAAFASAAYICGSSSNHSVTLTQSGGSLGTGATWHWYSDASFTNSVGTSSAADASLNTTVNATTTYYVRAEGGSSPCTANTGAANITVNYTAINTWIGQTADWNNSANWSCGVVPNTSSLDAIIPGNVAIMPKLTSLINVHNLDIQTNGTVELNGFALTVYGAMSGTGAGGLKGNTNSSLVVKGAAGTIRFSSGYETLVKLTLDTNATATLGSPLNIAWSTGAVYVNQGATLNTNGNLTLLSQATNTARVGPSAGTINGAVTVERYIPWKSQRAWEMLSVPTKGSQTIHDAWQEGQAATVNGNPGYGTNINSTSSSSTALGFDYLTMNAPSIQSWNTASGSSGAWGGMTSTNGAIQTTRGYNLWVNGDRSVAPNSNNIGATTLRTKGTLYQGTQPPVSVPATKYDIVGNIYASPVDFTLLNKTGTIPNAFYVWDPRLAGNSNLGAYQTFSATNGWVATPGGGSYGSTPNTVIQSGQAFMVFGGASGGTFTFTEACKSSTGKNVFRREGGISRLKTTLYGKGNTEPIDAATVVFDNNYSKSVDINDITKATNPAENFAVSTGNTNLAIEARPDATAGDRIQFSMSNMKQQDYRLDVSAELLSSNGQQAYLEDSYLHTSTALNMTGSTSVSFAVDNNPMSAAATRFAVVFGQTAMPKATEASHIAISPNPVTGSMMNVRFTNKAAGTYRFSLTNVAGQNLYATTVNHAGGSNTQLVKLPRAFAQGVYNMQVVNPEGKAENIRVVVSQ